MEKTSSARCGTAAAATLCLIEKSGSQQGMNNR